MPTSTTTSSAGRSRVLGRPGDLDRLRLLVTGTDTEVGKTVVTAALVAARPCARPLRSPWSSPPRPGSSPARPATWPRYDGSPERSDPRGVRLPDPLAPDTAARVARVGIPSVAEHAAYVAQLARRGDLDLVLVEGAGGLLVRLDTDGGDLADLGTALVADGLSVAFVVVAAAGLGTLNHSALTAEALRSRGLTCAGFVVGSWPKPPDQPDLAMRCNLDDLPVATGHALLGVLPAGAGSLTRAEFGAAAPAWLSGW